MFPTGKALREIVEQAMQDKAPQMYARLKADGSLRDEISRRMDEAQESYRQAIWTESKESVLARQKLPPMEQIQERTMQQRAAAEEAIAQATEFPSESETD